MYFLRMILVFNLINVDELNVFIMNETIYTLQIFYKHSHIDSMQENGICDHSLHVIRPNYLLKKKNLN